LDRPPRRGRSGSPAAGQIPRTRAFGDRGSVTAELAAALPALVLLLVAGLGAVSAVATKLNCQAAARDAALAAARGDPGVPAGRRLAPAGADITVAANGDLIRATVTVQVHPLGTRAPGFPVGATSVAALEPGSP
jgi:hypothetical protein